MPESVTFTNMCMVCDGDRVLVQDRLDPAWPGITFPGGHVEEGESFTDAVIREVWEETGLHVKKLQFYKSQPWVLTDTLLMGFFCELDGSDTIRIQEDELSVAQWFPRDQIPKDHSAISLTGEMIEVFRKGKF